MNNHSADNTDAIRAEIERTRQDLSQSVDALSEKLDVKHQAASRMEAVKGAVSEKASQLAHAGSEQTRHVASVAGEAVAPVVEKARPIAATAKRNRSRVVLAAGVGVLAVALLRAARR